MAEFNAPDASESARRFIAEKIVETIQLNGLLVELRCLRERVLSPCPDPQGHTHAQIV